MDSVYFQIDHRFATSHDYKVARMLANVTSKEIEELIQTKIVNKPAN